MLGLFFYIFGGGNCVEITRVKLSELRHDDKNARKHNKRNVDEVKRSIAAFGQHRPFVVQRGTNKVIVGNGMLNAMLELGITEGDAYFVDDDDETSIRRALADNRTGELAEWDMSQLKDLFQEMGPEPDVPGWDTKEIEDFMSGWLDMDSLSDDFALPDKERDTMRTMSFTLAKEQSDAITRALEEIKKRGVSASDTFGNTNSNGNALYVVIKEWEEQKK